ncbi:DNA topoisomerase IV subunit A [Reyranella sp. CPCC 100927]|uniref:DNA topoisomerase IV subunit A n=1 Tax=Reyranella sp. CPCC 100927 TaxID=2599616 RepID=UPI0011B8201F|nr:DNA topoisomerase IV subunit A [Reyranella sp. CPCC 100927]TWT05780.1 DNA topoisomerase IV subunit A [Reyranella sp. CPCC 100927]
MAKRTSTAAPPPPPPAPIRTVALGSALSERYLSYALSTIMARSLPDVRDGLKPVHRRLLYIMQELRLDPTGAFKKSARVVGDTMGKLHPHGDQSIYDALVRLAQDFATRYPLVDGQGNFGNIDGDNAAAMRYTEARLTDVAQALLVGINEDAVDFRLNFDGAEREPVVLPAAFPNLLANGAAGIAVGMATSIPPHNVGELCDALLHLIKAPNARIETLVEHVPGPDFPTGGLLVEPRESVIEAYKTGRGSFRVRARWEKESLPRGQYRIVITEVPYQVAKAKLVEKIAELINAKKLPMLEDVRDESAEDVRLVLEPKTGNVPAELLMEQMFKVTDLEIRFPLNLNVLDSDQVPRVMDLRQALQAWLDHRQVVLQRRSRHRLAEIERRLEILDGYLIAYLSIDEVIAIIRNEDEPKAVMMRRFKLSDLQAESILNLRLRALRRLEEIEIKKEHKELSQERKDLKALLADDKKQWQQIAADIQELRKSYGPKTEKGRRRTEIADAPPPVDVPIDAFIEKEPVTVVCSEKGWIRAAKGHLEPGGIADLKYKEGDREKFAVHALSTDRLLVFGTNGRFYTIGVDRLPSARGHGEPIRLMIDLGNEQDIVDLLVLKGGRKFLVAGYEGRGFIVPEDEVVAQTKAGKQVLNLGEGEEAVTCSIVAEGADHVAAIGENRKLLVFPIGDVPEMTRGRGVILQKHKDGGLSDAKAFVLAEGLQWAGRTKTKADLKEWIGERAQAGRLPPLGSPRANKF